MISKKGKRELEYQGELYYWYIKKDADGFPKIHIISEDKKLQLCYGYDPEICISPEYIKALLQRYYANGG